ncbi:MAG TPA: hypothetical protein VFA70_05780 [Dehalococcoidia bacterium]|nr:hypothetical protein [Dehalococcoidia bacterium]
MADISNYAIAQVLQEFAQLSGVTLPSQFYLALCSSTPTASQTGSTIPELGSAGGYVREPITLGAPSGGVSSTTTTVQFPVSSGAYSAAATAIAICDAPTGGNLWYWATLTSSITVNAANMVVVFAAGTVTVSVS